MAEVLTLATQAVNDDDHEEDNSNVWGRMIPLQNDLQCLDFEEDEYTIGRGEDCSFRIQGENSKRISNLHCKIYRNFDHDSEPTIFIEDLSTNGTFIDGQKLGKGKKKILIHGNEVALGTLGTRFYIFQIVKKVEIQEDVPEFFQKYDIREILGKGNFSTVKLGVDRDTGKKFAIKIIDKKKILLQPILAEAFRREVEILKKVHHPAIISYIDYYEDETSIFIVLELVTGGELAQQIFAKQRPSEETIKFYFFQMVQAVKYLHENNITHRDLKPENVLLEKKDSERLMITDFGLSKIVGQSSLMQTVCGTPIYLAPEILLQTESSSAAGYSKAVDLWSLGVILYIMFTGNPPFQDQTREGLFKKIKKGSVSFSSDCWNVVSQNAKDLILKLLVLDPNIRLTIHQTLQHPWLQDQEIFAKWEAILDPQKKDSMLMPPPQLKTGITSAFHQTSLDKDDMDVAYEKPTLANLPPSPHARKSRTETDSEPELLDADQSNSGTLFKPDEKNEKQALKVSNSSLIVPTEITNTNKNAGKGKQLDRPMDKLSIPLEPIENLENSWGFLTLSTDCPAVCSHSPSSPFTLQKSSIYIGRAKDSDIWIDDKRISKKHCRIFLQNQQIFVEDLSSNGTFFEDCNIGKGNSIQLQDNQEIFLVRLVDNDQRDDTKPTTFSFTVTKDTGNKKRKRSENSPEDVSISRKKTENGLPKVIWGELLPLNKEYPKVQLDEPEIYFGRGNDCKPELKFQDSKISARHCKIMIQGQQVILEDFSANGTFVNEVKIEKGQKIFLNNMDEIVLTYNQDRTIRIGYALRINQL